VRHNSVITLGALGDSFYEYLLKVYIYSGKRKKDKFLRKFYDEAVEGMENILLTKSEDDNAYYLKEVNIPNMAVREITLLHIAFSY